MTRPAPRRRLVDTALRTMRLPAKLATGSRIVLNGLWLGVLSDAELAAIDQRYYEDAGQYRTAAWNERGLFEWEQRLVDEHFAQCERVVVLAAGGGREVLALLQQGFDVIGYESHPDLVGFAQDLLETRGHPGRLHPSARDAFPVDAGPCDGMVVGWGAYSLMQARHRRVALLSNASEHLSARGPVLLSFFERTVADREVRWTSRIANGLRRVRRAEAVELGDTFAPNFVHVFTRGELAAEVEAAGLHLVSYWTTGEVDRTTRYACAVVRKR